MLAGCQYVYLLAIIEREPLYLSRLPDAAAILAIDHPDVADCAIAHAFENSSRMMMMCVLSPCAIRSRTRIFATCCSRLSCSRSIPTF